MTQDHIAETLHFYLHPTFWPVGDIPETADSYWPGFDFGPYIWTVQTALRLNRAGIPSQLVRELPTDGIVLAHRESLAAIDGKFTERVTATATRFVVDMSADLPPYSGANLHIVQNRSMTRFGPSFIHVRHWPQPGLIPRDLARGQRFENISYLGNAKNLVPELRSSRWRAALAARQLTWRAPAKSFDHGAPESYHLASDWHDYRSVDAIIAVRGFSARPAPSDDRKPASKLYNAWIAGVPAILGRESAYRDERRSELDYLEVGDYDGLVGAIDRLRSDAELRRAMIDNGLRRAPEVTAAATTEAWRAIVTDRIWPAYHAWVAMGPVGRRWQASRKTLRFQAARGQRRLARLGARWLPIG
ncbi:MAG TPA: hypothetical protein VGM77_06500 [Gemmatimonadales bacterium]|jgi:hypothetical protein